MTIATMYALTPHKQKLDRNANRNACACAMACMSPHMLTPRTFRSTKYKTKTDANDEQYQILASLKI